MNGKYEFIHCEDCNGPILGHLTVKYPKLEYDAEVMSKFKNYLKRIGGFKEAVWAREKKRRWKWCKRNEEGRVKSNKVCRSNKVSILEWDNARSDNKSNNTVDESKATNVMVRT